MFCPAQRVRFEKGEGIMLRILFFAALFAASWLTTEAFGEDLRYLTDDELVIQSIHSR